MTASTKENLFLRTCGLSVTIFFLLPLPATAAEFSSTNFTVENPVIESLGGYATSASYGLYGSMPYISTGRSSSTSFVQEPGFFNAGSSSASVDDEDDSPVAQEEGASGSVASVTTELIGQLPMSSLQPIITIIGPLISGLFTPQEATIIKPTPIELLVPTQPQLVFRNIWGLIPREPVKELVFRPLPREISQLAGSFPQLNKVFSEVGITRFNDLQKLQSISLSVPGLTDVIALSGGLPLGTAPGAIKDIQLSDISSDLKAKIPSGVLFAKLAGGKLDARPVLRLTENGSSEQFVRSVSGNDMTFAVKPESAASSVTGYLIFKSRATRVSQSNSLFNDTLGIKTAQAAASETAFVLQQFEYTDTDRDGIYTATIEAPLVSGEYEVVTVIDYVDPDLGNKVLKLVTVIDPEGYVYESRGGKETRIPGAIVSIEWFNPTTQAYQIWPASDYQQSNPQITTETGEYSFLVPAGRYRLLVTAPGYAAFKGESFEVREGGGIHTNIELKTRFWLFSVLDWKTIALLLISALLLYNFYRDKIRERREREMLTMKS